MENKRLVESLQNVHDELTRAERVDPEALALLRSITHDIERLLGKRADAAASDEAESEPPSNQLRELLLKFEADHPQLATSVGKVADSLAAMGF